MNLTWEKIPPEKGLLKDERVLALLQDPTVFQTLSSAYVFPVGVFDLLPRFDGVAKGGIYYSSKGDKMSQAQKISGHCVLAGIVGMTSLFERFEECWNISIGMKHDDISSLQDE
jgi:hypothetical protein